MRRITFMAAIIALAFTHTAQAQETCRAADITSDGTVSAPDFTALSQCYGQPVSIPLPSGQYVGHAAVWDAPFNALDLNQSCRSNFGPGAHWCSSLEMESIEDPTLLPTIESGEQLPSIIARVTPPVGAVVDWVTGLPTSGGGLYYYRSNGTSRISASRPNSQTGLASYPACCVEPTP